VLPALHYIRFIYSHLVLDSSGSSSRFSFFTPGSSVDVTTGGCVQFMVVLWFGRRACPIRRGNAPCHTVTRYDLPFTLTRYSAAYNSCRILWFWFSTTTSCLLTRFPNLDYSQLPFTCRPPLHCLPTTEVHVPRRATACHSLHVLAGHYHYAALPHRLHLVGRGSLFCCHTHALCHAVTGLLPGRFS